MRTHSEATQNKDLHLKNMFLYVCSTVSIHKLDIVRTIIVYHYGAFSIPIISVWSCGTGSGHPHDMPMQAQPAICYLALEGGGSLALR